MKVYEVCETRNMSRVNKAWLGNGVISNEWTNEAARRNEPYPSNPWGYKDNIGSHNGRLQGRIDARRKENIVKHGFLGFIYFFFRQDTKLVKAWKHRRNVELDEKEATEHDIKTAECDKSDLVDTWQN